VLFATSPQQKKQFCKSFLELPSVAQKSQQNFAFFALRAFRYHHG
jgi:hypothetical protein